MPGHKDWQNGVTLTEADMDDYIGKQVVEKHASSAARTAALTGFFREGIVTYLDDVNTLCVNTGATDAWSTIGPVHGALTTWTPVVTQSAAVASTAAGIYFRSGRLVTAYFLNTITGPGAASNVVQISLPVAADAGWVSDHAVFGRGYLNDVSAGFGYSGDAVLTSTTTMKIRRQNDGAAITFLGASGFTAALASGDFVAGCITYPAGGDA